MWMNQVFGGSGFSAMDQVIQFTQTRHRLLANNIANIDTPGYKMRDMEVGKFRQDLQKAIENGTANSSSPARQAKAKTDFNQYLLFQDQNNRSIEKQMTSITENAMMHNMAVELLRSRYSLLEKAISLRP